MKGKPSSIRLGRLCAAGATLLAATWCLSIGHAQSPKPETNVVHHDPGVVHAVNNGSSGDQIQQVSGGGFFNRGCESCGGDFGTGGCATCAQSSPYPGDDYPQGIPTYKPWSGGCGSCGCGSGGCGCGEGCRTCCYAGRKPCPCCWEPHTKLGKCIFGLYDCICCTDPCYEPQWHCVANAAFFLDAARPVTHMRLRYNAGFNLQGFDRAEYYMPRVKLTGVNTVGKGQTFTGAVPSGANYQDIQLYNEAAINGVFGTFVAMPYRYIDWYNTDQDSAAFGDLSIGMKGLILDCELIQFGHQFTTILPTGNFTKGIGTGHVSFDLSLLASIKCSNRVYVQTQTGLWIPVAGDQDYQGNIWHNHISLNGILWRRCPGTELIGTWETNNYTVINGDYTAAPNLFGVDAATGIVTTGPGLRMCICHVIDFGVGSQFAIGGSRFEDQLFRGEFRWRF